MYPFPSHIRSTIISRPSIHKARHKTRYIFSSYSDINIFPPLTHFIYLKTSVYQQVTSVLSSFYFHQYTKTRHKTRDTFCSYSDINIFLPSVACIKSVSSEPSRQLWCSAFPLPVHSLPWGAAVKGRRSLVSPASRDNNSSCLNKRRGH